MKKVVLLTVATLLLVLALVGVAQAATPQDIYNDFAADGALTGPYTEAELQAYLDDATIDEYGDPAVVIPLDDLVGRVLAIMQAQPGISFADALEQALGGQPTDDDTDTFPFTGFETMLALFGSVLLLGSGLAVRRATR